MAQPGKPGSDQWTVGSRSGTGSISLPLSLPKPAEHWEREAPYSHRGCLASASPRLCMRKYAPAEHWDRKAPYSHCGCLASASPHLCVRKYAPAEHWEREAPYSHRGCLASASPREKICACLETAYFPLTTVHCPKGLASFSRLRPSTTP